jgi:hypothetical protein
MEEKMTKRRTFQKRIRRVVSRLLNIHFNPKVMPCKMTWKLKVQILKRAKLLQLPMELPGKETVRSSTVMILWMMQVRTLMMSQLERSKVPMLIPMQPKGLFGGKSSSKSTRRDTPITMKTKMRHE